MILSNNKTLKKLSLNSIHFILNSPKKILKTQHWGPLLPHPHPPSQYHQYNDYRRRHRPNDRVDVLSTPMAMSACLSLAKFAQRQGEFSPSRWHHLALGFDGTMEYRCRDIECDILTTISLRNIHRATAMPRAVAVCIRMEEYLMFIYTEPIFNWMWR